MKNGCTSHSDKHSCELLERPRYFPRQLISDAELTLEQAYFRNKSRLHNRMLHGWGVVCGALVCRVRERSSDANGDCDNGEKECDGYKPWKVVVKPGYILAPCGEEIVIGCDHEVDLRSAGVSGVSGESTAQFVDPWCSEVSVKREPDQPYYVAVKYKECKTRPVRVQPIGCGCDDTQCEYSRWRDGYEIGILDHCPESHTRDSESVETRGAREDIRLPRPQLPFCPPCPEEPWVVLAKVHVDDNGCIESIDNCSCRRLVYACGHKWWSCGRPSPEITERILFDSSERPLRAGEQSTKVTIKGENFPDNATVTFGPGVRVVDFEVKPPEEIIAIVTVVPGATPGPREIRVIDPSGGVARQEYEVISRLAPPPAEDTRPTNKVAKRKTAKGRTTKKKA